MRPEDPETKLPASDTVSEVKPAFASQGDADSESRLSSDATPIFDKAAERRLIWKLDLLILPILFVFYMMSYLDRVNIGNASIQGMTTELALNVGNRYNIALLVSAAD